MSEIAADLTANWGVEVEELVGQGDVDGAISLLESVVAALEQRPEPDVRLIYALTDLAGLYRARGYSNKSDEMESRAISVRIRLALPGSGTPEDSSFSGRTGKKCGVDEALIAEGKADVASADEDDWRPNFALSGLSPSGLVATVTLLCVCFTFWLLLTDWESIADRELNDVSSPIETVRIADLSLNDSKGQVPIADLSLNDSKGQVPKRRGRGSFLYEKNSLYSDQIVHDLTSDGSDEQPECETSIRTTDTEKSFCGTSHVLVLFGFPPTTRTGELEKIFSSYTDQSVVIRWVNDTTALAVFAKASIAQDAQRKISFPFNVRILENNDDLLSSLSHRDLEPPHQRPKTSVSTAQRLIAHGMGRKLPTAFGADQLTRQEEDRRNRMHLRQVLKDEAWGPDGP